MIKKEKLLFILVPFENALLQNKLIELTKLNKESISVNAVKITPRRI